MQNTSDYIYLDGEVNSQKKFENASKKQGLTNNHKMLYNPNQFISIRLRENTEVLYMVPIIIWMQNVDVKTICY